MSTGTELYKCPLCGRPAQALELVELAARRIDCRKCVSYQFSKGLERILAAHLEVKGCTGYLSDAARRATASGERLKLTEENYLRIAAEEATLAAGEM